MENLEFPRQLNSGRTSYLLGMDSSGRDVYVVSGHSASEEAFTWRVRHDSASGRFFFTSAGPFGKRWRLPDYREQRFLEEMSLLLQDQTSSMGHSHSHQRRAVPERAAQLAPRHREAAVATHKPLPPNGDPQDRGGATSRERRVTSHDLTPAAAPEARQSPRPRRVFQYDDDAFESADVAAQRAEALDRTERFVRDQIHEERATIAAYRTDRGDDVGKLVRTASYHISGASSVADAPLAGPSFVDMRAHVSEMRSALAEQDRRQEALESALQSQHRESLRQGPSHEAAHGLSGRGGQGPATHFAMPSTAHPQAQTEVQELTMVIRSLRELLDAERATNADLRKQLEERDRVLLERQIADAEAEEDDARMKMRMLEALAAQRRDAETAAEEDRYRIQSEQLQPVVRPFLLTNASTSKRPQHPKESKVRFVVLGLFSLLSLSNAMQWLTYAPIPSQTKKYYDITPSQLNTLSTVYMFVYIGLAFVPCVGLERIGLRWCLVLGTGLNALGALLKVALGAPADSFTKILAAQVFNSLAQIFVLSIPPTLATEWFCAKERGTATAVGSVANALGSAFGFLVPPLLVHEDIDPATGFLRLFILQLVLAGTAFMGTVLFIPDHTGAGTAVAYDTVPFGSPTGDNPSQQQQTTTEAAEDPNPVVVRTPMLTATPTLVATAAHASALPANVPPERLPDGRCLCSITTALLRMLRDRDICLLILGLSISVGSVWSINSLLAQLLAPVNVAESDVGMMGFWNIVGGTVVALGAGVLVDRYRAYKGPVVGLAALNLVMVSMLMVVLYADGGRIGDAVRGPTLAGAYVVVVVAGIPQNVITPVGFEFACELCHGHPGSISGTALMALANGISLVTVTVCSTILGDAPIAAKSDVLGCIWLIWGLLVVGLVLLIATRNRLRRLEAERALAEQTSVSHLTACVNASSGLQSGSVLNK